MPFLVSDGKYVFCGVNIALASKPEPPVIVVPGGTATEVQVTPVTAQEKAEYKEEIKEIGNYTDKELKNAQIIDITASSAGTVNIDGTQFGEPGDSVIILHNNGTEWVEVYNGVIPQNGIITLTLTTFSPFAAFKKIIPQYDYSQQGAIVTVRKSGYTQLGTEVAII